MYRKDCFAYRELRENVAKCDALNVINCENCKFFKTIEEYKRKVAPLERR